MELSVDRWTSGGPHGAETSLLLNA